MARHISSSKNIAKEIIDLLDTLDIEIPVSSEIMKIATKSLIEYSLGPESDKYARIIRDAKKYGLILRKKLDKFLENAEGHERSIITSLFITFIISGLLRSEGVKR